MIYPTFNDPPSNLKLDDNEAHVWKASLDQPASIIQMLEQTLSMDEKKRAGCFYFEKDRRRFIVGRGLLRTILGGYLGIEPMRLEFCYGKNGKPKLADKFGEMSINFNLSHSGNLALYGFTRDGKIGVDIERIRKIPDMGKIAEQFFSVRENTVFHSLPTDKRQEAFYILWTLKEAFIKATGEGFAQPFHTFDVTLAPGEPAELMNLSNDLKEKSDWSLYTLSPNSGYVGAIAVYVHDRPMAYFKVERELRNECSKLWSKPEESFLLFNHGY